MTVSIGRMDASDLGVEGATFRAPQPTVPRHPSTSGYAGEGLVHHRQRRRHGRQRNQVGAYDDTAKTVTFDTDQGGAVLTFDKCALSDATAKNGSFTVSAGSDVSTQAGASTAIATLDAPSSRLGAAC